MNLIGISGSPSLQSRSGWLLDAARERLATRAQQYVPIAVRELPAEALLHARFDDPAIRAALATVARADVVIVATPIYKAAYSGLLKAFLDLLPQDQRSARQDGAAAGDRRQPGSPAGAGLCAEAGAGVARRPRHPRRRVRHRSADPYARYRLRCGR